jgi:hypothetical protein
MLIYCLTELRPFSKTAPRLARAVSDEDICSPAAYIFPSFKMGPGLKFEYLRPEHDPHMIKVLNCQIVMLERK